MRLYIGDPQGSKPEVYVADEPGMKKVPIEHISYYAPKGASFAWGITADLSLRADLALSILSDYFQDPYPGYQSLSGTKAWKYHKRFDHDFLRRFNEPKFLLSELMIQHWLLLQENIEVYEGRDDD